jgi:hypothetical protein
MNGESDPSLQPDSEVIKKIPVAELLKRAGEAFDNFHDELESTHNHRILIAKMKLLNEIVDECEKYGEDWDEHKDRILPKIHGLNKEMAALMEEGRFAECSDRIGYGHSGDDRYTNILYILANECSKPQEEADTPSPNDFLK